MAVLPNTGNAGFKLVTVLLSDGEWSVSTAPILAFLYAEEVLTALTPAGPEVIEDQFLAPAKGSPRFAFWAHALQDPATGEVFGSSGQVYSNPEAFMAALQQRERRMAERLRPVAVPT